jgi:hypothetical protein
VTSGPKVKAVFSTPWRPALIIVTATAKRVGPVEAPSWPSKRLEAASTAGTTINAWRPAKRFCASLPIAPFFRFTPKHRVCLNQIDIWFSILVRKVIRHGSFSSVDDRCETIKNFIDYFTVIAKPFR